MNSGRDVLHRIDASIAQARGGLGDTNRAAAERSARTAAIERAENDAYRAIAGIRLDHLQSDELTRSLGETDEEAERLLASHEEGLTELAGKLSSAREKIERLEQDRRKHEEALEKYVDAHERAVDKTNERLETDEEYRRRASALEAANAIVERAEAKRDLARADRTAKGAPYEDDPLFSYLWERNFATKDYRAFFLFAALDRWVAGLIRYRNAKLNYARLLELPERLADHVEQVETTAADIEKSIAAYERDALERDGVGKMRDKAKAARAALEDIDASIANAEAEHQTIARKHADATAGRGGPMGDARKLIAKALADRSIPDLKILAAETLTLEDDHLVDELIRLRRERLEIEEHGRSLARTVDQHANILGDLETVRRRFKSARFDSPYSEFPDRGMVGVILAELLRGAINERNAWRRLQKAQRQRKRDWSDDFGGAEWRDGFGLPQQTRGSWSGGSAPKFPRTPRKPRAPRAPRAPRVRFPRRGGGGFKTGGGF